MISSPWRPGIALATQVLEFCKVLDLFYKVLECLRGAWEKGKGYRPPAEPAGVGTHQKMHPPKKVNRLALPAGAACRASSLACNRLNRLYRLPLWTRAPQVLSVFWGGGG